MSQITREPLCRRASCLQSDAEDIVTDRSEWDVTVQANLLAAAPAFHFTTTTDDPDLSVWIKPQTSFSIRKLRRTIFSSERIPPFTAGEDVTDCYRVLLITDGKIDYSRTKEMDTLPEALELADRIISNR